MIRWILVEMSVKWIGLAEDRETLITFVNAVMDFRFP
jgi:hypothetical protein